jgi:hypothetical protein
VIVCGRFQYLLRAVVTEVALARLSIAASNCRRKNICAPRFIATSRRRAALGSGHRRRMLIPVASGQSHGPDIRLGVTDTEPGLEDQGPTHRPRSSSRSSVSRGIGSRPTLPDTTRGVGKCLSAAPIRRPAAPTTRPPGVSTRRTDGFRPIVPAALAIWCAGRTQTSGGDQPVHRVLLMPGDLFRRPKQLVDRIDQVDG